MKKYLCRTLCAAALALAWGCSDSDPVVNPGEGTVIETAAGKVSQFFLNDNFDTPFTEDKDVKFTLVNPSSQLELDFTGTARSIVDRVTDHSLECRMIIGKASIPDGYYYITISVDGARAGASHYVMISNNTVTPVKASTWSYTELAGDGSKEKPYKINSTDDFMYFINAISADPDHGYGQYFVLDTDIDLTHIDLIPQETLFQGSLDGQDHRLTGLSYVGANSGVDTNVGLFGMIFNATITGLEIPDAEISGVFSSAGVIAGVAKGTNTLSDLKVSGNVSATREAGGLVGYASGSLAVKGCDIDINVQSTSSTGGIVGTLSADSGAADMFSSITVKGKVNGGIYAGGLVGMLSGNKSVELDAVTNGITVEADSYAGGFFGYIGGCYVKLTGDCSYRGRGDGQHDVRAEDYVGTLAGYVLLNGQSIHINDHYLEINSSVRADRNYAGGLLGYVEEGSVNLSKLKMSADCTVEAGADYVGGLVGATRGVFLKGYYSVNDNHALPAAESYHPIFSGKVTGHNCVGGIAGMMQRKVMGEYGLNQGYINGCVSAATVTASGEIEGGVVGKMDGDITSCVFLGHINTNQSSLVGGIAGKLEGYSETQYCINYSPIDGGKHQGGIAGYANPSKASGYEDPVSLHNCYNLARLTGGCNVGGIVGYAGQKNGGCEFNVYFCENYGDILAAGSGSYSVGGIVGDADNDRIDIHCCYNYANVSSRNVQFVIGGVVGKAGRDQAATNIVNIHSCMNVGKVSCDNNKTKIGGVVGHLMHGDQAEIHGCVNWGDIAVDQKDDTGGILGCATLSNLIVRNWNTGLISHGNGIVGTHTTASAFYHYGNYILKGSGARWPDAIVVNADDITSQKTFPDFPFAENPNPSIWPNFLGEAFAMSSYGPVPYYFDFIHWDSARLTPPGWKKYPDK